MKNKKNMDLTYSQNELKKLIEKNYSYQKGGSFLFLILSIGIGMIIYGGFTKNWASIFSGVLIIGLVVIM